MPVPWALHVPDRVPTLPQIASELKDTISTRLRSARNSISGPIASTSDKVLGAALAGCELAWGVAKDTAEYAASTRAGRLASGGADLALGSVEKVVELLLPPAKEKPGTCHEGAGSVPLGWPPCRPGRSQIGSSSSSRCYGAGPAQRGALRVPPSAHCGWGQ